MTASASAIADRAGAAAWKRSIVAPWPDERAAGVKSARPPTTRPPIGRLQRLRKPGPAKQAFDEGDPSHDGDAEGGANNAKQREQRQICIGEMHGRDRQFRELASDAESPRDEDAADRRRADRRQPERRIGAENEFEGVEGACQGAAESRGDGAGGPAGDERAQIGPPHPEHPADEGGEASPHLRIGGLKPD